MKPEYKVQYDALGLPFNYTDLMHPDKEREAFFLESANNHHALKSAVEELRDAVKETLGAWHGGTMNDVRAAMTLMEEALKETEGLV